MKQTSRTIAWMVWVIVSIFYAYQYILRVMPSIMIGDIMLQFGITPTTFGQFSGIYYIGYSLMHLPIGIALDRWGPKKVMTLCILLTVAGMSPLIFATHWMSPIVGRLFVGIGSSAAILGIFKIVRMAFSEKLFPRMLSFSVMIGLLGAIYGGAPLNYMRDQLGYTPVLEIFALVGVILAGVTYLIIPDIQEETQGTVTSNIKEVIGNKKVLFSCLFAGLMVGPLEGFADVWGTIFLNNVMAFESTLAASLPSMIFMGMCFGAPVLSFIADRLGNTSLTIICAGVLMTIVFTLLLLMEIHPSVLSLYFILVGICSAYQILAIYKVSTYVRQEVAGLATAMANMIIMLFGYAFHSMIGGIVGSTGGTESAAALKFGIAVIPIALFIGTIGFIILYRNERQTPEQIT